MHRLKYTWRLGNPLLKRLIDVQIDRILECRVQKVSNGRASWTILARVLAPPRRTPLRRLQFRQSCTDGRLGGDKLLLLCRPRVRLPPAVHAGPLGVYRLRLSRVQVGDSALSVEHLPPEVSRRIPDP